MSHCNFGGQNGREWYIGIYSGVPPTIRWELQHQTTRTPILILAILLSHPPTTYASYLQVEMTLLCLFHDLTFANRTISIDRGCYVLAGHENVRRKPHITTHWVYDRKWKQKRLERSWATNTSKGFSPSDLNHATRGVMDKSGVIKVAW